MSEFLLGAIETAFNGHGIAAHRAGDQIHVGDALKLEVGFQQHPRADNTVILQVDFKTTSALLGERGIVDSFAGVGTDERSAQANAFSKFLMGSFHVIAEALTPHPCDSNQVDWLTWSGAHHSWRVCSGALLTQGTGMSRLAPDYEQLLLKLRGEFEAAAGAGPHWMHIFVAGLQGEISGVEAILDGAEWSAGRNIVLGHEWNFEEGYQSLRHLMIALPHDAAAAPVPAPRHGWLSRLFGKSRRSPGGA